jgi:hypothetical protein
MYDPSLTTNEWFPLHYKVRVRPVPPPTPPQCIWGSAGLIKDIPFTTPLILHIRNDVFGEQVTFGTQQPGPPPNPPTQTVWGTLQPGECVSIPLQGYSGVFAYPTSGVESTVYCSIKGSA